MSQAAVFMTCQMPLKSGLPSGGRGSVLPGVCARATETAAATRRTIEIAVAEAEGRYGMATVLYTRCVCRRQRWRWLRRRPRSPPGAPELHARWPVQYADR